MLHALGPAEIADVNQSVDSVFNLDERAEVGEIAYAPFNGRVDGIFLVQALPRVRLELLESERNATLTRIHVKHHALDLVADVEHLGRMLHALGPRHLAYVDQSFNALLQLDESAVVGHAQNAAFYAG